MNFGENTCLVCSKRQCFYPQNRIEIGFPGGPGGEESACSAGDPGSIPGQRDLLEKGMTTHSSIRRWEIPWTGEPGGLYSP